MNHSATAHIESQAAICGGQPCITGTRIRVQDIYVWHELQGSTADEIVSRFPQITPADVYAALAFYWDHRDEIRSQMDAESAFVEALKQQCPSPLAHKLAGQHAADHPIPS